MTRLLLTPLLALGCFAAANTQGQVLLQENFSFTGLITNNGWIGFSGTTNFISADVPKLTFPNLPSSGVGNSAGITNTGQDAYKLLASNNSTGDIYTSFLINVSTAGTGDYFYSLYSTNSSGGGYFTRVFTQTNATGFSFGVSRAQSTNSLVSYETNVRSFNTTYLVVAKMSRAVGTSNDVVSLWVNPLLGAAETSPLLTNNSGTDNTNSIAAVALRQGTTTPGARLGNILVGTTWASVTPSASLPVISPSGVFQQFFTFVGTASASQSLVVGGSNLTAGITATAPAGLEVSSDNASFGPTATLPSSGGTLYARVAASASTGELNTSITLSSTGATDVAVPVTASVRPTSLALPYGPDTFTTTSFPWYTYTAAGTVNWTRTTLEGNSFMQINGFTSTVPSNAWLILGPFNFPAAQNIVATFNMQKAYAGPDTELNLKYSTDYSGLGDPASSTWVTVPFTKPASVGSVATSTVFTPSGAVSLPSELAGQSGVYLAFHYEAAGTGLATSLWRMDDFELFTSSSPVLSILVNPSTINEGSLGSGTVSIPAAAGEDVTITVTSADPAVLLVDNGYGNPPAGSCEVPIFAGETSALFNVTTTRDFEPGTDVPVQITAESPGYTFGQTFVTVRNIDLPAASLTSGGYTQNFAGFTNAATLPLGWSLSASTQTYSEWATTTAGPKYSSAAVNVFGYQHTGSTGVAQQILTLKNDTGAEINDLVVSYYGRMFENAGNARDPSYTVTVNGVTYPALAYSTSAGDNAQRVAVISGLTILPGQTVQINWTSDGNNAPGSNTRRQIGISEVNVSAGLIVLPPSIAGLAVPLSTIGQTSAEVGAEVTADGGSAVTARGFVYAATSVNANPEIGGTGVTNVADSSPGVGVFAGSLTGLSGGTQYSVRAYATNAQGTTYTTARTFTTLGAPISFNGVYAESFNDFTDTTSPSLTSGIVKAGWTAISSLGAQTYVGPWASGSTSGGFFGGVSGPGVLGYQHTSSTGTMTVTLRLLNDTGVPLTQLYVQYLGRAELLSGTRFPQWTVTVAGVAAPDLTYSTSSGADETKSALVTGLSVPAGGEFTITWVSDRDNLSSGNSRRIGLADVVVSTGAISSPTINVTGSAFNAFSATVGTPSAAQNVNVTGSNLTGNLTVTAPTGFQVSSNGVDFSSSVSLAPSSGSVAETTVSVRLSGAAVGTFSGNVDFASTGATTQQRAVSGTVTSAYDAWAASYSLTGGDALPTSDPDKDGFNNNSEYAFGTVPNVANRTLVTVAQASGNALVTWIERNSGFSYAVQSTANLSTTAFANDSAVSPSTSLDQAGVPSGYTRKQFTVLATGNKFYRVSAAVPAP